MPSRAFLPRAPSAARHGPAGKFPLTPLNPVESRALTRAAEARAFERRCDSPFGDVLHRCGAPHAYGLRPARVPLALPAAPASRACGDAPRPPSTLRPLTALARPAAPPCRRATLRQPPVGGRLAPPSALSTPRPHGLLPEAGEGYPRAPTARTGRAGGEESPHPSKPPVSRGARAPRLQVVRRGALRKSPSPEGDCLHRPPARQRTGPKSPAVYNCVLHSGAGAVTTLAASFAAISKLLTQLLLRK